jgi:DNA (cytosine-5)-methyltransferase 1
VSHKVIPPIIEEGTQSMMRKFRPYTLEDMNRESEKELFSVVTTFSGGGGSSVGYKLGGGKISLMNEFIKDGVDTYLLNHPNTPYERCDIRKISRKGGRKYVVNFFKSKGIDVGGYDILDGSPPCSTFSNSGKGKHKIEEKNVKYSETTQSRIGMLINDFVYFVNCTKPKICIVENVPNIKGSDVFQYNLERLKRRGYKVNFKIMNSAHFGVPQNRRRLICVGIRGDVCDEIGLQSENEILDLFPTESSFHPTVRDGLRDVKINEAERRQLILHTIRSSSYELIKTIPKNQTKPMKISDIDPNWKSDFNMVRSSWDHPSPTLTQMGQQMGRGGIFHPSEDRVFTTDEMKSLMGLPKDYKFSGNFNQRIERMGRMVSPLIYKYLSKSLYEKVLKPTQNLQYVEIV